MKTYFLLFRKISPYTGADLLLGVFDSVFVAQRMLDSYFEKYSPLNQQPQKIDWLSYLFFWLPRETGINQNNDPWYKQAYKSDGLIKEDLIIQSFDLDSDISSPEITVVSCYYDSMGMITREIDSIHISRSIAETRMLELQDILDNSEPSDDMLPNNFHTQTITINTLQSDKPEDQPVR